MPYPGYVPPISDEERKRQDELMEKFMSNIPLKTTVWDPKRRENEADESMGSEVER